MRRSPVTSFGRLALATTLCFAALGPRVASAALPPALAAAYAHDVGNTGPGCVTSELIESGTSKDVKLRTGQHVLFVRGDCGCGASNCAVGAYVADGNGYRKLVMESVQDYVAKRDGSLVMTGEDDAYVSDRTTYRWNGRTYALVSDEMIYAGSYEKPATMPIAFAAGTSTATLRGDHVTERFTDNYTFAATAGQRLTLAFGAHDPKVDRVELEFLPGGDSDAQSLDLRRSGARYTLTLPKTGKYSLVIGAEGETFRTYAMQMSLH